ncbi:MAG: response regulator [Bacillota bacterium]|jgi:DNA-binding response OmpR family regulator
MADKVLIVEDDEAISELIQYNLQQAGFETAVAFDGETGLKMAVSEQPSLILLDVMLPGMDGWAVCRELRKQSNLPVLFLTAKDDELNRVLGLELGADDYVTKPFSPRELVARVKAVLRRYHQLPAREVVQIGKLQLDLESHEVTVSGQPIALTPMEFQLLNILAVHRGQVFTRERLLHLVWGDEAYGDHRTVDVHISHLREKLGVAAGLIQTVRGFGYRLKG